ncbi:MAG: hypothetical protein HY966_07665 [Ignavibacteriales bacterium]|nr:hypothetical protein [Ignavibacteriales bacterium]
MAEETKQASRFEWKWVISAVIAGLVIVGASYFIVAPTFHSAEIQVLVMLVGYIGTGAIIGYFSPGVTINEASVGGLFVSILMYFILKITGAPELHSPTVNFLLLALGIGFAWVGGWAGEKLQGDESSAAEKHAAGFQWKWVVIGVVVGFALNILFVFLLAPALKINLRFELAAFIISFVATGFVVGYKSPGVTITEPAVAGLISVVLDWIFLKFALGFTGETLSTSVLSVGLSIGFLFAMFGAWLGEKYQESLEKKS